MGKIIIMNTFYFNSTFKDTQRHLYQLCDFVCDCVGLRMKHCAMLSWNKQKTRIRAPAGQSRQKERQRANRFYPGRDPLNPGASISPWTTPPPTQHKKNNNEGRVRHKLKQNSNLLIKNGTFLNNNLVKSIVSSLSFFFFKNSKNKCGFASITPNIFRKVWNK